VEGVTPQQSGAATKDLALSFKIHYVFSGTACYKQIGIHRFPPVLPQDAGRPRKKLNWHFFYQARPAQLPFQSQPHPRHQVKVKDPMTRFLFLNIYASSILCADIKQIFSTWSMQKSQEANAKFTS
jgi:hypothetical protein